MPERDAAKPSLSEVVEQIYSAVEDPGLWPAAINVIGSFVGGPGNFWLTDRPLLQFFDSIGESTFQAASAGCHGTFLLSRADLELLDRHVKEVGDLIVRLVNLVFTSMSSTQTDLEPRELVALRMARRYLSATGRFAFDGGSELRGFIAALWESGRMFRPEHLEALRLLAPHLDRALRLQLRLREPDLQPDTVSGVLDQLAVGVILLGRDGQPVWHNQRAHEIIEHSKVLQISSKSLNARNSAITRELRELVQNAVSQRVQGTLTLPREDNLRPLLVTAISLAPPNRAGRPDDRRFAWAALFISDPDQITLPSVRTLRRAFGLTHREAQMAISIADGQGLKAAAARMGVATTTARTQLQQIFAKTSTNHQAELAVLVRTLTNLRDN